MQSYGRICSVHCTAHVTNRDREVNHDFAQESLDRREFDHQSGVCGVLVEKAIPRPVMVMYWVIVLYVDIYSRHSVRSMFVPAPAPVLVPVPQTGCASRASNTQ